MKYKAGDRVRIKSLDWYNENKDEYGYIDCGSRSFFTKMSGWCGKIATIEEICKTNCYRLEECGFDWTDEMIEGLVEEEMKPNIIEEAKTYWDSIKDAWICPQGYQFKDENGNVINATKIVLEKKKKKFPKTYEECLVITPYDKEERILYLLEKFKQLLICRNAYWKIAGEEMGLGKPWEPDYTNEEWPDMAYISYDGKSIDKENGFPCCNMILIFPTEEMRDAFYENFKEEIEICKELL